MNNKLTPKQRKALTILRDHPGITARAFGYFYFDQPEHEYLQSACSNQGTGACHGKKLWLCAGSLLGKLVKKGWAIHVCDRYGHWTFRLTEEGKKMIENQR